MVEPGTPEQDFARFRDAGDLRALGRVFDRLAPQLLLVAAHVTRDAALAEDLVQTTFLEAIRSASRWSPERAVLPWLSGILVHHAWKVHRRDRRGLDRDRLHERTPPPVPPDAAAAQELAEAVQAALHELPRHYRQVLALRLVHDLQPAQIAHTLGCPPETVKTRLRRGLELLRRLLPRGFAVPATLLATQGRGLAAVRAEVLRAAPASPTVLCCVLPLFPLSLLGGVVAMKKLVLGGVVAAVERWRSARLPATRAASGVDGTVRLEGVQAGEVLVLVERRGFLERRERSTPAACTCAPGRRWRWS